MDEGTKKWLEKIEGQLSELLLSFTKSSTELSTKLDLYMSNQEAHETRLRELEEYKHRQEGINAESDRKANRILVIVVASEVVLFGIGLFLAKGM